MSGRTGMLVAGASWGLAYLLVPDQAVAQVIWTVGTTVLVGALTVVIGRMSGQRTGWVFVAVAMWCMNGGNYVMAYHLAVGLTGAFPTAADALYLSAYPLLAAGVTHMARGARGQLRLQPMIDGLILAAAAGLAVWIFLVSPSLADTGASPIARIVSAAYPLGDLLLLVACTQLLVHRLHPSPALWMLLGAITSNLTADIAFSYLATYATYTPGGPIDLLWWTAYMGLLAAACHPSATTIAGGTDVDASADLRASRLVLLSVAALAAPVLHAILHTFGDVSDTWVLIGGTCGLFALVIARLWLVALDLEHSRRELRHRALHDELTGLANRALFNDSLAVAEQRAGGGYAVLLVDVDDFKSINDTFGHAAGDVVLWTIGQRLDATAPAGSLVARIGGDEFAILLTGGIEQLEQVAEELVDVVRRPMSIEGDELRTSISCGGAVLGGDHTALHLADEALHEAKQGGRDRHVVLHTSASGTGGHVAGFTALAGP